MDLSNTSDTDSLLPVKAEKHSRHKFGKRYFLAILCLWTSFAILLSLAIAAGVLSYYQSRQRRHELPSAQELAVHYDCGWSVAEARMKGCHFDIMAYGWIPAPCYESDIVHLYQPFHESSWFFDAELTRPVLDEQTLLAGEQTVLYTDLRFHQAHCLYLWQVLFWTVKNDRPAVLNTSRSEEHRNHCDQLILYEDAPFQPLIPAFLSCVRSDGPRADVSGLRWLSSSSK